jgi:2-polyprenyl-3-methyl-5-hydroxy-6-metoxy-1,4-benzoquinol methylase
VDVLQHDREAWNGYVAAGNRSIVLTPTRPVPRDRLGEMRGARILALASGGGQQGPILAAAGGRVTVLDLETVPGDMADLGAFADATFDLVVNPVSTCFVPDARAVK